MLLRASQGYFFIGLTPNEDDVFYNTSNGFKTVKGYIYLIQIYRRFLQFDFCAKSLKDAEYKIHLFVPISNSY